MNEYDLKKSSTDEIALQRSLSGELAYGPTDTETLAQACRASLSDVERALNAMDGATVDNGGTAHATDVHTTAKVLHQHLTGILRTWRQLQGHPEQLGAAETLRTMAPVVSAAWLASAAQSLGELVALKRAQPVMLRCAGCGCETNLSVPDEKLSAP